MSQFQQEKDAILIKRKKEEHLAEQRTNLKRDLQG
jgi:hypothetical protein